VDAVGQELWDWVPMLNKARWRELWRAAAQRPVVDFRATVRLTSGEERLISATLDLHQRGEGSFVIAYARDITEQHEVEERARASEERYERLADNASDIIFRYEFVPVMGLTYINSAVEAMTGYTPDDCYADPQLMYTMVHPDDAALMASIMESRTPTDEPMLMRWIGKDGVTRWMESRIVPVRDDAGRLLAVEGITRDVTQRRQTEEALRQSKAQLRTLIDTLPDLVWLKDPEGVFLSCNRRFESLYGAAEKDIVGKTDYDFVDAELADFFRQRDSAAAAVGGAMANEEELVFADDGHSELVETIKTPVLASDGRLIGVLGVARDITDRKRAEEALRQSEERFRRASQATSDFAYSCVKRPGGNFVFDWLTGAVERVTGWSREELLEQGCWQALVLEEDVPLFEERVTGLAPGDSSVCELRIRDKEGRVR
jgi:PAS domain S-box-containing protein